jgi:hypothetical protein
MTQTVSSATAGSRAALVCAVMLLLARPGVAQPAQPAPSDVDRGLAALYERVEQALVSGEGDAFRRLITVDKDPDGTTAFATGQFLPGATRAVVRERDREAVIGSAPDSAFHVLLDVFVEFGNRGSARSWRFDVLRGASALEWSIGTPERLTAIDGLFRLSLDRQKQYRITNLKVTSEDLTITIPSGVAFGAVTPDGPTAFVLLGRGELAFSPTQASERGQVRILANEDVLRSSVDGVFVRLNPWDLRDRLTTGALTEAPVDARDLRRAETFFTEEIVKSFGLELSDLSREHWSLVPPQGDFLAEMRTSRFGTLTYTRSGGEPEDITLFDRKRRRNVAVYASTARLSARGGRFYSEDDERDYDVQHYGIQAHFDPKREWVEGRTELRLRVSTAALGTLTLRLAEPLVVRAVTSPGLGRLLTLRVKGQNSVIVNLPRLLSRNEEFTLTVSYAGRLPGAVPDREAIAVGQEQIVETMAIPLEPRTIYTNRSYWYAQPPSTDFATAMLRLTMPDDQTCVATGIGASGNPVRIDGPTPLEKRRLYVFVVDRPARYFAVALTRLEGRIQSTVSAPRATSTGSSGSDAGGATATTADAPGASAPEDLTLSILANPRQMGRARSMQEQVTSVWSTYASILGEFPYSTFTLALVDDPLPGGHSPAYFALLHQPLPSTPYSWRNDPVSFDGFPQFFLAHEIAHQYWGNAVGWQNYHEQWISEGFAQYFAVLYAERTKSRGDFEDVLRQLRRTAASYTRDGPVWLGYRLGHLQGDGRVFRALVYNKGALVLHMLRRLVGDEVFFQGLRRFYRDSKFRKVGTGDVQRAFEAESGQSLERFFNRWIIDSDIPSVRVAWQVERPGAVGSHGGARTSTAAGSLGSRSAVQVGGAGGGVASDDSEAAGFVVVRLEQTGETFDLPVTVTLDYATGASEDVLVRMTEKVVETRLPLRGPLREIEINRDNAALVEIVR